MNCQFRRSARIAPHTELYYKDWVIPKNVSHRPRRNMIAARTLTRANRRRPSPWPSTTCTTTPPPTPLPSRSAQSAGSETSIHPCIGLMRLGGRARGIARVKSEKHQTFILFGVFRMYANACCAVSLASAELYLCLGTLFRPGGPYSEHVALRNCDETDFALLRESEFGAFPYGSRGLGVVFA